LTRTAKAPYPKVLIEVLSETTEAIDRREKFLSYKAPKSLLDLLPIRH